MSSSSARASSTEARVNDGDGDAASEIKAHFTQNGALQTMRARDLMEKSFRLSARASMPASIAAAATLCVLEVVLAYLKQPVSVETAT